MKTDGIFTPLMKTIDKVIFGFAEVNEIEKQVDFIECDNDEEFDVERSVN